MSLEQHDSLSELDFGSFKHKVKQAYSLDLDAYKRPQMERRLRANMDKCGASSFMQYFAMMQRDAKLADEFLDRVTINVSELFRNPDQFDTLQSKILPELLTNKKDLSIWSAGCSYGAEPYTLAVLLNETAPGGKHTIMSTDIDERMLARARAGVFQQDEMRNVSRVRISKYFDHIPQGYKAKDSLRKWLNFQKHSLLESRFRTGYDLIVCRNVVIYFTEETKSALYRRFYASLRPGGYLFVGGTERVIDANQIGFENRLPFFYRKPVNN